MLKLPYENSSNLVSSESFYAALAGSAFVILIVVAYEHSTERQQQKREEEALTYWCRALAKSVGMRQVELHDFLAKRCPASFLRDNLRSP